MPERYAPRCQRQGLIIFASSMIYYHYPFVSKDNKMVFGNLKKKQERSENPPIFLGSPEAEAEALATSQIPLSEVYEDYHNLFTQLSHEKFIVIGRKGSGKSAFAEYCSILSESEANSFCKFIRHGDANLEKIIQIGKEQGHDIEIENLFKWLIYTNILKLFAENESISTNKDYQLLLKFLRRNSGYIDIRENEIKELIEKQGFDVQLEYFRRFFTAKHKRDIQIKKEKAPFYKLIPHLEETIKSALLSPEEKLNNNSYALFFDDLDIGFHSSNASSVNSLISLLRVAKTVNNDIFGKLDIKAKVIILIRDDIGKLLSSRAADTAKIFSTYSAKINWVPTEVRSPEISWNIRRFINKRITAAFRKKNLCVMKDDPWQSLVNENLHPSSSFRYILDITLYRPRDLILFFRI